MLHDWFPPQSEIAPEPVESLSKRQKRAQRRKAKRMAEAIADLEAHGYNARAVSNDVFVVRVDKDKAQHG